MKEWTRVYRTTVCGSVCIDLACALGLFVLIRPGLAVAQGSPFLTGATALQSNILAWLTPVAIILVMVLGAMAMAARMPSELEQLPDLTGYVKTASSQAWVRVAFSR